MARKRPGYIPPPAPVRHPRIVRTGELILDAHRPNEEQK